MALPICGLQKLTLLDYPGRTACTVFLGGCNFRCPFCHNASLVLRPGEQPQLSEEAVLAFLRKRRGVLDGVCVTGGEPTLQRGLPSFLEQLKTLGYAVKLDTNGTDPRLLAAIMEARLVDCVAMDIKSSQAGYAAAVGLPALELSPVLESAALLREGSVSYEFRTTVVRELHTPAVLEEIGRWLKGPSPYFLQAFVDSGDLVAAGMHGCSRAEMQALLEAVRPYLPKAALRGIE